MSMAKGRSKFSAAELKGLGIRAAVGAAGAALLTAGFLTPDLGWVVWFSFVPFFWLTMDRSPARAFLWGWFFGFVAWGVGLLWSHEIVVRVMRGSPLVSTVIFTGIVAYHALMFALAAGLGRLLSEKISSALRTPSTGAAAMAAVPVWVTIEGSFPQLFPVGVANSQVDFLPALQSLDLFGMAGLSWLIVGCNAALYVLLRSWRERRKEEPVRWRWAAALAVLAAANLVYGGLRMRAVDELSAARIKDGHAFRAAVIQGSIPRDERFDQRFFGRNLERYNRLTREAVARETLDLVVWPQGTYVRAVVLGIGKGKRRHPTVEGRPLRERVRRDVTTRIPTLLSGIMLVERPAVSGVASRYRRYMTVFAADREGRLGGFTQKQRRIPFTEYIPLRRFFPFLYRLRSKNYTRLWFGDQRVIPIGAARVGSSICYEEIIPEHARRHVRLGANLLVPISSDSQFGDTLGTEMHLRLMVLRSIETRRWQLRAVTSGISAVIDPAGRVLQRLEIGKQGILLATAALLEGETLHVRTGRLFYHLAAVVSFLLAVFALFSRRLALGAKRRA